MRGQTFVYVANADSREIVVARLESDGALREIDRTRTSGMVMPLAAAPGGRFLHAALRSEPYGVASYRIDPQTGRLSHLSTAPLPASMAYIATDRSGRFLLGASYSGAVASVSAIDAEGRVAPTTTQVLMTAPNAHCIVADPANRFAFIPCLGGDLVMQLKFDARSGRLSANAPDCVRTEAGAGPRHLVFHPDHAHAYLLDELDATVVAFAFDGESGLLSAQQTICFLPEGFSGKPWAADIHLTPDGRFLYASERTSSTLAGFAVDEASGALAPIGHWPTETQPRGFAIDPSGHFLLCAGQMSNSLTVHAIDPASGALAARGRHKMGANPNWVEIVAL
ncbi:MAG: beta-propeller fold lactonase family protein [Rhodospirillaceae bacterium]|nr:beta-propeller fold lactonase family protein [Rhodospirillaceae bacterium]